MMFFVSICHKSEPGCHLGQMQIKLPLPAILKKVLIDDWERITKEDKRIPLPRKPIVSDILTQYVDNAKSKSDAADAETEVANGLRIYFDKALKQILLYNQEQAQSSKVTVATACMVRQAFQTSSAWAAWQNPPLRRRIGSSM